jgi:hypothetical protein
MQELVEYSMTDRSRSRCRTIRTEKKERKKKDNIKTENLHNICYTNDTPKP